MIQWRKTNRLRVIFVQNLAEIIYRLRMIKRERRCTHDFILPFLCEHRIALISPKPAI